MPIFTENTPTDNRIIDLTKDVHKVILKVFEQYDSTNNELFIVLSHIITTYAEELGVVALDFDDVKITFEKVNNNG